jgi:hypothetical protein
MLEVYGKAAESNGWMGMFYGTLLVGVPLVIALAMVTISTARRRPSLVGTSAAPQPNDS